MYLLRTIQRHAYPKADCWPKHRLDYGEMMLTESLCGLQDAAPHFVPGSLSYPSRVTFLKHRTNPIRFPQLLYMLRHLLYNT